MYVHPSPFPVDGDRMDHISFHSPMVLPFKRRARHQVHVLRSNCCSVKHTATSGLAAVRTSRRSFQAQSLVCHLFTQTCTLMRLPMIQQLSHLLKTDWLRHVNVTPRVKYLCL